jgi:hypothetical protein
MLSGSETAKPCLIRKNKHVNNFGGETMMQQNAGMMQPNYPIAATRFKLNSPGAAREFTSR